MKEHKPIEVAIGFGLGIITMLSVKFFAEKFEEKQEGKQTKNNLPIGLLVALALETFSLGLAVVLAFGKSDISKKMKLLVLLILGLIFFVGAIIGITLLSNLSQELLELVLSFGLAALLFLVTEELLTEAHEEKETLLQTSMFFVGFLIFLLIGMVA